MYKLVVLLFVFILAACNNSNTAADRTSDSANKATVPATDSVSKEAAFSFIDGCVENAKLTLGEQKAYVFCKCIYDQAKSKYPDMDSARMASLDTAEVARMAAACR